MNERIQTIRQISGLIKGTTTKSEIETELKEELKNLRDRMARIHLGFGDRSQKIEMLAEKHPEIVEAWKKVYSEFDHDFAVNTLTEQDYIRMKSEPGDFKYKIRVLYHEALAAVAGKFNSEMIAKYSK